MSKSGAQKRRDKQAAKVRSERKRTGYSDPKLVNAAIQNGYGKGSQKVKRDKLKHGIRIGNGTDKNGEQRYQTVSADKAMGAFLEPNESKSYIVPGGYARAVNHPSRMADIDSEAGDARIIPTPEATRFVKTIK